MRLMGDFEFARGIANLTESLHPFAFHHYRIPEKEFTESVEWYATKIVLNCGVALSSLL